MSAPCFSLSNKDLVVVQGPSLSNFSKYAVYLVKPATVIDRHAKYIPLGLYAAELKLKDPYRGLRREEGLRLR
ncbi:MAG: hypothetical protein N3H31_05225 [Candidatus Nezhaarchaeota archaeon]|nr:hypothetical protein [Candidatus Nezhaarchaeota archaeon]